MSKWITKSTLHQDCEGCAAEVVNATRIAGVTGSRAATSRSEGAGGIVYHEAVVTRVTEVAPFYMAGDDLPGENWHAESPEGVGHGYASPSTPWWAEA